MFRALTIALTRCSSRVIPSKPAVDVLRKATIGPTRCSGNELSSSKFLFLTPRQRLQNYSRVKKFAAAKMRHPTNPLLTKRTNESQNAADATEGEKIESVEFLRFLDATVNSYVANLDLSAETIANSKQMRDNEHYEVLGSLWKDSLAFNPLAEGQVDTRFMEAKVTDPVYSFFSQIAREKTQTYTLFSLRAIPGAGKTATILNAIGRNAFLIYTQCGVKSGRSSTKDYVDVPFEHFYDNLDDYVNKLIQRGANKGEKTKVVKEWCVVFWLCRVKLFHVLKQKYPEMKPSHWIFWTNNGGGAVLHRLQADIFLKLSQIKDWWSFSLGSSLDYYCKQQPTLWFAVDEAQVIQDAMKEHLISNTQVIHPTNLLHVLAVQSLPVVPTVVAGTRMARFEELEGSYGGKGSSIFKLSEAQETYPYVTPEEGQRQLGTLVDLTGITNDNMNLAKKNLQGRLRYVFGFIRHLYVAARLHKVKGNKAPTKDTPEEKNKIFKDALMALEKDIDDSLKDQWAKIIAKTRTPIPQERAPNVSEAPVMTFPEHILTLLMAYFTPNASQLTWNTDVFKQYFHGVTPEDTGFLFFEKVQENNSFSYHYAIREPQLVPKVMKLLSEYFPQHAMNAFASSISLGPSTIGFAIERMFAAVMMAPNFKMFLQQNSGGWCNDLNIEWVNLTSSRTPSELTALASDVKKVSWGDVDDIEATIDKHYTILSSINSVSKWLAVEPLLKEISEVTSENPLEKPGELLFMLGQPTHLLLQPSKEMGPDLVGFCTTSTKEKVLVLVSLSFTPQAKPSEFQTKFTKNQYKQEPKYFYSKLTEKQKQEYNKQPGADVRDYLEFLKAHDTLQKIQLPKKVLMICCTMPDKSTYPIEQWTQDGHEIVRIYVNQLNMKDISVGLNELLNHLIALGKPETKQQA